MTDKPAITLEELRQIVIENTAAQSMVLAAVLRPLLTQGTLSVTDLQASLRQTESAALSRRTREVPALTGLIAVLRRDLGLPPATRRDDA